MSIYTGNMERVYVSLPESAGGGFIPTVLTTKPEERLIPKTNGQPGHWKNTFASGFQLAPDGITVYEQDGINLAFVKPREEVIDALDCDENGEVMTRVPAIPAQAKYLYERSQATMAARRANGGGTSAATVKAELNTITE